MNKTQSTSSHLSLEDIYLPVLDVYLVPQFAQFVCNPILVLRGRQRRLRLLLDHLVLLLELLSELVDLY